MLIVVTQGLAGKEKLQNTVTSLGFIRYASFKKKIKTCDIAFYDPECIAKWLIEYNIVVQEIKQNTRCITVQ